MPLIERPLFASALKFQRRVRSFVRSFGRLFGPRDRGRISTSTGVGDFHLAPFRRRPVAAELKRERKREVFINLFSAATPARASKSMKSDQTARQEKPPRRRHFSHTSGPGKVRRPT
jgi:hypothetical protein